MNDGQARTGAHQMTGAEFTRDTDYVSTRITRDGRDGYPVEPGRYRLIAARACPWANRAIIVRRLLGLEDVISMGLCAPTHDERSWTFDLDPGFGDTVDFVQIKQHYYIVHADINPTQIVPRGPDLSGWLLPHGREQLGGRPFGDGTPPPATASAERVPAGHGAHATGAKQSMDTVSMGAGSKSLATSRNGEVHR